MAVSAGNLLPRHLQWSPLCWAHVPVGLGDKQLEWLSCGVLSPLGTQFLQAVCQDGALPHRLGLAGFPVLEPSPDLSSD